MDLLREAPDLATHAQVSPGVNLASYQQVSYRLAASQLREQCSGILPQRLDALAHAVQVGAEG